MKRAALLLGLLLGASAFAQHQYDDWHFGHNRSVDFSGGTPVAHTGTPMMTDENCASICDASGNLLFYTNGLSVWDKNDQLMPNGNSSLRGWPDVQQGVLIVPRPNSSLYYIFTIALSSTAIGYNKDLFYSVVDMTANGGNGDLVQLNVFVDHDVTEKLTATRHRNGTDYWVVYHPWVDQNQFKALPVTAAGIGAPVVSTAGLQLGPISGPDSFTGAIKISQDGCWMASTVRMPGILEVFNFNNLTGAVYGGAWKSVANPYGLEFSRASNFLYLGQNSQQPVLQYNILAGNEPAILASETAVSPVLNSTFAFQLAPDGKIYFPEHDSTLSVIEYPDLPGTACAVTSDVLHFADGLSTTSCLPNNFNLAYTGDLQKCAPESVDETSLQSIRIFPNPANDAVSVLLPVSAEGDLLLRNVCGQIVAEEKKRGGEAQFSTAHLPDGVYLLQVMLDGELLTQKIVVRH